MVALDTHVRVRCLAQDDPKQSAAATRFIEQRLGRAARAALQRCRTGNVDLQDCLIVSLAEPRKARGVTFDAKAARRLRMELLR